MLPKLAVVSTVHASISLPSNRPTLQGDLVIQPQLGLRDSRPLGAQRVTGTSVARTAGVQGLAPHGSEQRLEAGHAGGHDAHGGLD